MDFDRWRAEYDYTSFADQVAVYEEIAAKYPHQKQFNGSACLKALAGVRTVTELGGWRGELAGQMLTDLPLERWTNYDICKWATDNPACDHPNYRPVHLAGWAWNIDLAAADCFVASHTLEHIRWRELLKLAEQFDKFRVLHLDIPVGEDIPDWSGYFGTHILEVGWREIDRLLQDHGFVTADQGHTRTYNFLERPEQ